MAQRRTGNANWLSAIGPTSGNSGVTELLETLLSQSGGGLTDTLAEVSRNIANLVPASQLQAQALLANTQAIVQNTSARSSGGTAGTISQIASTFTGGLLGSLSPILSGVLSLFGGGGSSTPPPLATYIPPPSLNFEGANAPGGTPAVDFGQSGSPRAISSPSQPASQITVQVQAMDSRSFMDHSQEIAQAVRDAMLNMHALNDVISDL